MKFVVNSAALLERICDARNMMFLDAERDRRIAVRRVNVEPFAVFVDDVQRVFAHFFTG